MNLRGLADEVPACPAAGNHGRGLVTAAGGYRLLANAYVNICRLRRLSDLPIELFFAGASELPPPVPRLLEEEFPGLRCYDLGPEWRGWQIKPQALLASSFQEALWLDADNFCLESPGPLFEHPEYLHSGALFWPDRPEARWTQDRLLTACGLDPALNRGSPEFEAGQLVLDKSRCWEALQVTARLNSSKVREFVYSLTNGDKDTFRLAFWMTSTPCAVVSHSPLEFGAPYLRADCPLTRTNLRLGHRLGRFFPAGLLQHHPDGRALLAHKTVLEWNPYHDFPAMTQLRQAGQVREAPELAALERQGHQDLRAFRRRYGACFPHTAWERLQRPLQGLAVRVLDLVALALRR